MSTPFPLGRLEHHDPRSKLFPAMGASRLKSVRHERTVRPYDQGTVGACTGMAMAGALMTKPLELPTALTEPEALHLYSRATHLDRVKGLYPPDDTGSTGLGVAKAAKEAGLITEYRHCFALSSTLATLVRQPVIVGTLWFWSMFDPQPDGQLIVDDQAGVAGGHEYELEEIEVAAGRAWLTNSWSADWGLDGRAWMSFDTLGRLLKARGDVIVPIR